MAEKNEKCICCFWAGFILLGLGIFADFIGLRGGQGYGLKQILVIVAGLILLILGSRPCMCSKFCKLGK